jgi:hypothetical protein
VISRRDAAQRLDIPVEMLVRHEFPAKLSDSAFTALATDPPAWLVQSRANRSAKARPVWVSLECDICGFTDSARPKKWWPEFTYLSCDNHDIRDLPEPADGLHREEFDDIAGRFIGVVDR